MTALVAMPIAAVLAIFGAPAARADAAPDPVVVAAGDISGKGTGDSSTARLLDALDPTAVLTLGDNAGSRGTLRQFRRYYRPTWGRAKDKTRPTAGDRDYGAAGGRGYFKYFGPSAGRRGRGYYSFDIGEWHAIALNSNCARVGGCHRGSRQERWLRADLAAHPDRCTLAFWHHPRFTSGRAHGPARAVAPLWRALYDAGADVVLNAHNHHYERFAPQDPAGRPDPARGLRQFVVGTGGQSLSGFRAPRRNSVVRNARTLGVLELTLHPRSYDWRFVPRAGRRFTDAGSADCRSGGSGPPSTSTPSPPLGAAGGPSPPSGSSTSSPGAPAVVTIAGDIAGGDAGDRDTATSDLVLSINPDVALTSGDNAYTEGSAEEFAEEYDPTWGRFKSRTRPVAGNHEYHQPGAGPYFDYFGAAAGPRGKGFYSHDIGDWHLIALNSNVSMSAGSEQEQWLRADLAAAGSKCVMAYWHHPRWTSSAEHDPNTSTGPLWEALYDAGADLVVNGHNHHYERFGPQNPAGVADPINGIREFVVGTGGAGLYGFGAPKPNSEVRNNDTWGVLRLTLHRESYDWKFEPAVGSFTDSGSNSCHHPAPPSPPLVLRGMYDREEGGGYSTIAGLGFNLIDSGPAEVEDLTGGLKGLVWVGDYSNCSWEVSDAELAAQVQAHVGDPTVGVWFISDEPDVSCPDVYRQHADRAALIHAIDPDAKSLAVVDSNSAQASLDQLPHWRGTADYIGLDPYPCHTGQPCAFGWIDRTAAAATAARLRWWGVVQAFADPDVSGYQWLDDQGIKRSGSLRLPTPAEVHEQFVRWRAAGMRDYLVFAWRWPRDDSALWLANQPDLQSQLKAENE